MGTRALVVGGTSGIGYAIACRLATNANSTIVISGRSKPSQMPHANMEFRPVDASSMRSIKQYTDAYKSSQDPKLDFLILSQGILSMAGRTETPEGIDVKMALHFYGRQLIIRELTPILKEDAKVVIILDAVRGSPEKLNWEDLGLETHFSLSNAASHCISMNDAMIQYYAAEQKGQGTTRRHFIHAYPGFVKTSIGRGLPWYLKPLGTASSLLAVAPETCAERLVRGIDDCIKDGEEKQRFWSCIDDKGNLCRHKAVWTDEQLEKVANHTWGTIDAAMSKTA